MFFFVCLKYFNDIWDRSVNRYSKNKEILQKADHRITGSLRLEIQEATVSVVAAKESGMDAAVVAILSEYLIRVTKNWRLFSMQKMFLLYSHLVLARVLLNTGP